MLRNDLPTGTPSLIDREARRRHLAASDRASAVPVCAPVILVPTPAQIARGQRIVDAPADFVPAAAQKMRALAGECGWATRLTYSHVLAPPKRGGEDWREVHVVALRVSRPGAAGFAAWADAKPDGAQMRYAEIPEGRTSNAVIATVTEFEYLLRDETPPVVERGACPVCRAEVRMTKAGPPYSHKFAGAKCPGAIG